VIPAYNEEARLGFLLETLARSATEDMALAGLRYVEAVIVDDGSTDATSSLLRAAAREDDRIRPVLGRTVNRGKGAAIAAGIAAAHAEMVLLVDVDLSTPLSDVHGLAGAIARGDGEIAIGSRDLEGAQVEAPRHRRLLGAGFNRAVRLLTGLDLADTQCGFKLIDTATARELVREQISEGFAFDVELLMRARIAGLRVVEVPVTYVHDDRSKVRVVRASLEMARDLVRVASRLRSDGRRARRRPLPEDAGPT